MSKPIAVLTSDWHLWGKAPVLRSEDDWFGVMEHAVKLVFKYAARFDVPVFVAGDIFDSYDPSCELLNAIVEWIPNGLSVYAVPGQHDLQNHNMDAIGKTGFETLCRIGRMIHLHPDRVRDGIGHGHRIRAKGIGWKEESDGKDWGEDGSICILLRHRYVYASAATSYKDAPEEFRVEKVGGFEEMRGDLNVMVFGDNHIPFWQKRSGNNLIVNCGTLICRKADEDRDSAGFYVLFDDGSLKRVGTRRDSDVYSETATPAEARLVSMGMKGIIRDDEMSVPDFETEVRKKVEMTGDGKAVEFASSVFETCRRMAK